MSADHERERAVTAAERASGLYRALAPVPEDEIAKVADEILEYRRFRGLRDAAAIGGIVLARFFSGRPELWRSHRPDKDTSLRKLAARLRGVITQSGLRRCVRIYLVALEHPSLIESTHLTLSHADEVYGLTRNQQEILLTTADREKWNIAALRQAKRKFIREAADLGRHPPRGRPVSPPEFKAVTRLENALAATFVAESLLTEVKNLHSQARQDLLDVAKRLQRRVECVLRTIETVQTHADRSGVDVPQRLAKGTVEPTPALPARAVG